MPTLSRETLTHSFPLCPCLRQTHGHHNRSGGRSIFVFQWGSLYPNPHAHTHIFRPVKTMLGTSLTQIHRHYFQDPILQETLLSQLLGASSKENTFGKLLKSFSQKTFDCIKSKVFLRLPKTETKLCLFQLEMTIRMNRGHHRTL